jgi:hypothetical protein
MADAYTSSQTFGAEKPGQQEGDAPQEETLPLQQEEDEEEKETESV